ncbi:putative nepenthesin [Helianthus annuus]|uniref:Nepenthesin n=1 Tax=Helianthus annuus TaxID=4232 RepID=A0A251UM11_HELAN|nr:probable aspartic proteinase GIP2 [Helianthus annuus]KAF5824189.1 putative nepenthesin [Helianthus annuus]KAJ0569268.1 putative nepenthesin [Helianthus annuus]KAJ0575707.1 putative nepenthesin [Helianthus annuus]KAJ0583576.1 putative nepenthesin [Helianthus annuus]KAJ0746304.1 putative nepenthesin [Helianthus annuus]
MASSQTLTTLFIFSLLTISYAATDPFKLPKQTNIHFPIRKNQTSLQYYTTFEAGNPQSQVTALIDLGAQAVWFDCTSYVSSSYKRSACGSNRCKKALGSVCVGCNSTPRPGCSNNTCGVYAFNPLTKYLTAQELGEDTVRVTSSDGHSIRLSYDVPKFQFSCADAGIVEGLPGDNTKGLVGFARTDVSLVSQISSAFSLAKKFALCIPSSSNKGLGDIFIGGGPYYMPPRDEDQSLDLSSTPLVINPVSTAPIFSEGDASDEYFINVKSIEVDHKRVAFNSSLLSIDSNGVGGTKISTVVPYTTLHSSIYKPLVNDFVKAAAVDGIKRVASVAPFGACFDAKTAPKTLVGPAVPDIDLILEGINIWFTLYGSNTMVEVKKNVICLAFVDGGAEPRTSIVLGGHQLENRVLEFDLAASKLGFSQPLQLWNTSCSHYRLS